jgi:DNA primase catalytic subunit
LLAFSKPVRVSSEEFGIKHAHHRGAGTRGAHHIVCVVKKVENLGSHASSFITVTRVEGRLAATGLRRIESDLDIQPPKHLHHTLAHLGEELVAQTSYKEGDSNFGHV